MAFKREKTVAAAQKAVRKGNYDRAIKEYRQLIEYDPKDKRTRLKMADVFVKLNKLDEALREYKVVAQQYSDDDFHEKAAAIYKQALRIAPEDPKLHEQLGGSYFQYGRLKDAVRAYSKAEKIYKEKEDFRSHLQILEKMVELDPENIGIQIQLAERCEKNDLHDRAISYFEMAAIQLRKEGRLDEFVQVSERMIFLSPGDLPIRKEITQIYLDRNDNKRALRHLQVCFKATPEDIETLELLGMTFHRLGDHKKALLVYKQLVEVLKKKGDEGRVKEVYRTILRIEPLDRDANMALQPRQPQPQPQRQTQKNSEFASPADATDSLDGIMFLDDDDLQPFVENEGAVQENDFLGFAEEAMKDFDNFDLGDIEEIPTFRPNQNVNIEFLEPDSEPEDISAEKIERIHLSQEEIEKVQEYVAEAEVFLKYKLMDQAVEVLGKILAIEPNHHLARKQSVTALEHLGDQYGAAQHLVALAKMSVERKNQLEADNYIQRAFALSRDRSFVTTLIDTSGLAGLVNLGSNQGDFDTAVDQGLKEISNNFFDFEFEQDPAVTGSREISNGFSEVTTDEPISIDVDVDFTEDMLNIDNTFELLEEDDAFDVLFNTEESTSGFDNPFAGGVASLTSAFKSINANAGEGSVSEFTNTHVELGLTYFQMELFEEAIEEFRQALNDKEAAPNATMHIALCHLELGNKSAAKEGLQRLVLNPDASKEIRLAAGQTLARI